MKGPAMPPGAGPDPFLAERETERLVGEWLAGGDAEARRTLRGAETTWTALVDAARAGALFSTRRAIVVRQAEALKGDGAEMVRYLAAPNPDVRIVLVPGARPDGRRPVWKRLAEGATAVVAETPRRGALRAFVREEARKMDLRLDAGAVEEIAERFGQDLWRVVGELQKVRSWSRGPATLSAEDLAPVLGRGSSQPLYALSDAVVERDVARAAALVEGAVDDREEPLRLLGTMHRALRQVGIARGLDAQGVAGDEAARALGLNDNQAFKVPDLLRASRRWGEPEVRGALRALARADRNIKRSADGRVELLAALMAARPVRPAAPRGGR
jgi:DNA polymerase-3 subunit delta